MASGLKNNQAIWCEVGQNLQDHLLALGNLYRARQTVPPSKLQHSESLMYLHSDDLTRRTGSPDIVLGCVVAPSLSEQFIAPAYGSAYTILAGVTHPSSRGEIRPTGPGRKNPPIIDPHNLETECDRFTFRQAIRTARAVDEHAALGAWRDVELLPGPECQSDTEIDAFVARAASTHHHPVGTCRMGRDEAAVLDETLAVRGSEHLFVVDASMRPSIPSGPVNAAIVAVAETWSSLFQGVR